MNYYELLNIARDADSTAVKRAYFSAVKLHSPDFDPEGFKAIRTAYETLSDPKKRAEYDTWFTAPDGIQSEILAARKMVQENKYKLALEFLTELIDKNPDSTEAKRLLAETFWHMNKIGTAEKICKELIQKNPRDCDTLLLRAEIAESRGHWKKAGDYYNDAVKAAPLNQKAWIKYLHHVMQYDEALLVYVFDRAMAVSPDMFRDEYYLYLLGASNKRFSFEQRLFSDKKSLEYFDKFAEFFIADKNPSKLIYHSLLHALTQFIGDDELVPFFEKVLLKLESSRYRHDNDEDSFKSFHAFIMSSKIRSDIRIHDVLADLTEFLIEGKGDKTDRLEMECYIVFNIAVLRPSIRILMNEYPECFKLHQTFYLDALNERKTNFLTDKYLAIYKKLKNGTDDESDDESDDEEYCSYFDEPEEIKPFVREDPKVGRNAPCPCGSGKKYKKCCG